MRVSSVPQRSLLPHNKSVFLLRSTSLPRLIRSKMFIQMSQDQILWNEWRKMLKWIICLQKEKKKEKNIWINYKPSGLGGKEMLTVIFLLAFIYYHHPSLPNVINMCPREQRIITFYQDQHDNDKHCEQLIGRCLKERAHCGLSIGCCQRKDFLLAIDWAV